MIRGTVLAIGGNPGAVEILHFLEDLGGINLVRLNMLILLLMPNISTLQTPVVGAVGQSRCRTDGNNGRKMMFWKPQVFCWYRLSKKSRVSSNPTVYHHAFHDFVDTQFFKPRFRTNPESDCWLSHSIPPSLVLHTPTVLLSIEYIE